MAQDNKKIVYITSIEGTNLGVYTTKEKAFERIGAFEDSEWWRHAKITQTVNTQDGQEEQDVDKTNYHLGIPIHVHVDAHREDLGDFVIDYEDEDAEYLVESFELNHN